MNQPNSAIMPSQNQGRLFYNLLHKGATWIQNNEVRVRQAGTVVALVFGVLRATSSRRERRAMERRIEELEALVKPT